MTKEVIQLKQYESRGPYHRYAMARWIHPDKIRYEITQKLLPGNLSGYACLDYGGGDGIVGTLMANQGAVVTVFDPISIALTYAQRADKRLRLVEGKTYLPMASDSYDIVTLLETLEHIPDDEEMIALSEIYRVLKNNGQLILSVPSIKNKVSMKHYRHYSLADLEEKLTKSGFSIDRVIPNRHLALNWAGKPFVGKVVRGLAYGADKLLRSWNGNMGLIECDPEVADDFVILATKRSLMQVATNDL